MVETVNAQTLQQSASGGSSQSGLEPGTAVRAKVESNLTGGVVRLATENGTMDLRVAKPLPVGAEVSVTVGGTKQQPVVQITTTHPSGQTATQAPLAGKTPVEPSLAQGQNLSQGGSQPVGSAGTIRPFTTLSHLLQPGSTAPQASQVDGNKSAQQRPVTGSVASSGTVVNPGGGGQSAGQPASNLSQGGSTSPAASASTPSGNHPQSVARTVPTGQVAGSAPSTAGSNAPVSTATGGATGTPPPIPVVRSMEPGAPLPLSSGRAQVVAPQASGTGASPNAALQPVGSTGASTPPSASTQQVPSGNSSGSPSQTVSNSPLRSPATAPPPGPGGTPGGVQNAPGQQRFSGTAQTASVSTAQGNQALPTTAPPPQSPGGTTPSPAPPVATGAQVAGNSGPTGVATGGTVQSALQAGTTAPSPQVAVSPQTSGAVQSQNTATQSQANISAPQTAVSAGTARADVSSQSNLTNSRASRSIPAQPYPATREAAHSGANTPSVSGTSGSATQTLVQQTASAMAGALVEQQAGLGGLFAQVGTLAAAQSAGRVSLPDPVIKAMQQIMGLRLNTGQMPSGRDIQHAVQMSGQFREAKLSLPQGGMQPLPDLKSMLLSFRSLLQQFGAQPQVSRPAGQPAAPTLQSGPQGQPQQATGGFLSAVAQQNLQALLKDTDQALARIRLTQLVNAGASVDEGPQATSRPMDLVVELPLSLGQETAIMQLQVGRDGGGSADEDDNDQAWRLRFSLDLTATGPLEAAISLRGGGTYASLWVDRKETFDQLEAVRETMEAAFADAGLDLQELRLIRGLPPKTAAKYGTLVNRQS